MAYYLSKGNKAIADLIADKLKDRIEPLILKVNNPNKLEHIIRSASSKHLEYNWIKDQFIIKTKEDSIIFYPRQLYIEEIQEAEIIPDQDFFSIINILVLQKKSKVNFVHCILTLDEVSSIESWCVLNGYSAVYQDEILKIQKNA